MKLEVEQKFAVRDPAALVARVAALGAVFGPPQSQVDRYFNHASRDFAQTDEALRIRTVGDENFITYKGPKLDQTTKTRRELELPIGSVDAGRGFTELLLALSFRPVADVRKSRRTCGLQWNNFPVEVVLDEVQGLGTFMEIEVVIAPEHVEAAKSAVINLAQHLGLQDSERRSYLELLLQQS